MAQHEQSIDRMEEATRKLRSSQSPEEQQHWAQEIQTYAEQFSSSKKQSRTGLIVEAAVPSTETVQQLLKQVDQGQLRGVREITYRRDPEGTGRIRVSTTQEALPEATTVLNSFGEEMKRQFSRSSSS